MRGHADALWRDMVHATRGLRRHPVSTATAVLSLAVGIGLNTAVFSVVNGVLWQDLPFPASDRLVMVGQVTPESPNPSVLPSSAFLDLQRGSRTLERIAAGSVRPVTIEIVGVSSCSASLGSSRCLD